MMVGSQSNFGPTRSIALNLVIALGGLFMVAPFYWLLIASTQPGTSFFSGRPILLPGTSLWANLSRLFSETEFAMAIVNSTVVAALYTFFGMIVCSMAGYAFAKFRFVGQSFLFGVVLLALALPSQVTLVPLFQIMVALKWLNTYQALILPNLALPFGIFLMRQSMTSIPDELIEAARMDGAGEVRIFAQIVIPVVRPALAALAIFLFLAQWNEFVYALIVLREKHAYTIPVALASMLDSRGTDYGALLTGTMLSVLPVLGVFLLLQRHFVAGMLAGAVKQ